MTNSTAPVAATEVVRAMYAKHLPLSHDAKFDLIESAYQTTAALLGLEYDTRAEAADAIGLIAEQAVALMYSTAGITDAGSEETPECMATIGQAREVMARAADVSGIRLVQPIDDERRAAHLFDVAPDVD